MILAAGRALQGLRKLLWRFTGRPPGVHALPLTAERRIVLVKLTYARDWRLPGGGRKRGESPAEAVLRELAEEIGMTDHGAIDEVTGDADLAAAGEEGGHLFIVRGVRYRPKRSWEIAAVEEFHAAALPSDLSRRWKPIIERLFRPQDS